MTPKEIRAYIKLMQKEGVLKLKTSGLELELALHAFVVPEEHKTDSQSDSTSVEVSPKYSEEDLLFWSSSPGIELKEAN